MFKDGRYINAGQNEFHRWGHKAIEKLEAAMIPNAAGYLSIPADGGKYWSFGTSTGKYGEFAKFGDMFFSVNKAGNIWAKEGTEKGEAFKAALAALVNDMRATHHAMSGAENEEEE